MSDNVQRTRLLASGLLAITFVAGALVGAAGDRLLTAETQEEQPTAPPQTEQQREREPAKRNSRGSILLDPKVLEELGTTADQRAKINAILERRDQEAKRIYEKMEPEMVAMMKQTREEIRAQLTADQLKRLDQLIDERRARWRQNRNNAPQSKPQGDSSSGKSHERDHEPLMI